MTPVLPQKSFPTDAGINWLMGSRDGSLWMATYHGVYRLKDGEAFSLPIKRGGVESILEDHDGVLWITRSRVSGAEGALCRIGGNDLRCYAKDQSDGNPARFATALTEDSSGDIWFGCQMLCRWNGSSISSINGRADGPSIRPRCSRACRRGCGLRSGRPWTAWGRGWECATTVMEASRAMWFQGSMEPRFERQLYFWTEIRLSGSEQSLRASTTFMTAMRITTAPRKV